MSLMHCSLLSLGCAFGFSPYAEQKALTGLRALKIAQRRLRPEVRSKLLSATSARTGSNLSPEAWRFVFLDQGTSGHCRVVTVAAKASSEHPDTIEAFNSVRDEVPATSQQAIAQGKLMVDSDKALALTRSTSKLKGVRAAEYRLSQGRSQEPMWTISLFGDGNDVVAQFQVGAKLGVVKILQKQQLQLA